MGHEVFCSLSTRARARAVEPAQSLHMWYWTKSKLHCVAVSNIVNSHAMLFNAALTSDHQQAVLRRLEYQFLVFDALANQHVRRVREVGLGGFRTTHFWKTGSMTVAGVFHR